MPSRTDDIHSTPTPKERSKSTSSRINISNKLIPPFAKVQWRRIFIPALERVAGALTNPWLNGENDKDILLNAIASIVKVIWPDIKYKVTFESGLYRVVSSLPSVVNSIDLVFGSSLL